MSILSLFGSRFLGSSSIDFGKVYGFGNRVVHALHKLLISNFSKTTEDNNPQIYSSVILKGVYILTGNDVISYFLVHATAAVTDFMVTQSFFFVENLGNY